MIQALLLKVAALSLLLMLGQNPNLSEEFRTNAEAVAHQALTYADSQLSISTASSTPSEPTPPIATTAPSISNNSPAPMPEAPVSQARIEITALPAREYTANDYKTNPDGTLKEGSVAPTDNNSADIRAIVYDVEGKPTNQPTVVITATDRSQDKTLKGTGNVMAVYNADGQKNVVPVYVFHYEFRSSGDHQVTFSTNGLSQSITISVK